MRPVTDSLPGVSSTLVRLGHLFESSRFHSLFSAQIDKLAAEVEIKEVLVMPAEAAAWQDRARKVLEQTRPALDIDVAGEEFLLTFLNGNPNEEDRSPSSVCTCGVLTCCFPQIVLALAGLPSVVNPA